MKRIYFIVLIISGIMFAANAQVYVRGSSHTTTTSTSYSTPQSRNGTTTSQNTPIIQPITISAKGGYVQKLYYYDSEWKGVKSKNEATYYRIANYPKNSDRPSYCSDYYITGELQGEAGFIEINAYDDRYSVFDGDVYTYYKSGALESSRHIINGKTDGNYIQYSENGERYILFKFNNDVPDDYYYLVDKRNGTRVKYNYYTNKPYSENNSQTKGNSIGGSQSQSISKSTTTATAGSQVKIKMRDEGGVYTVPCTVNGLNLRFIFDTGASDVHISLSEALFMLKNGYLSESDIIGSSKTKVADGSIVENTKIILRKIEIGGKVLNNITAYVVHSIDAPLLLGQSAIQKLGGFRIDGSDLIIGRINNFDNQ